MAALLHWKELPYGKLQDGQARQYKIEAFELLTMTFFHLMLPVLSTADRGLQRKKEEGGGRKRCLHFLPYPSSSRCQL